MSDEKTDEELLAEFQQGDAGAFERLLRRHRRPLYTFLVRMLGDRAKAEDLAQESFLRIVKGAAGWEHRARFQTWLYTIARNLCVGEEGPPVVETVAADTAGPDRGAENARMRPLLQEALLALPVEQREVFVLREQAGVPFKEIAELLGVNENTVKSRMRYALQGLRKSLAERGITGEEAEPEPEPPPSVRLGRA